MYVIVYMWNEILKCMFMCADDNSMQLQQVDEHVSEMYCGVRDILSKYRSGKLPKAFKIIPSLANWEQVSLEDILKVKCDSAKLRVASIYYSLLTYTYPIAVIKKFTKCYDNRILCPRIFLLYFTCT